MKECQFITSDPGRCHLCSANVNSLHRPEDQYSIGRQKSVAQSLDHESGAVYRALCDSLTWTLTVQTTSEDVFGILRPRRTCDSLFFDAFTYLFTYLLTYLR